jgi:hypothetical protein
MTTELFQFAPGGDWISMIIWFVMLLFLFFLYPRMMVSQIMWKLDKVARDLEKMSDDSKRFIHKHITPKPDKKLRDSINRFFEFFVITPVDLDPYGIVRKFDHILNNQRDRFRYFVNQVAPKFDPEKKASLEMGFAGGMTVHQIAKIVRHYVELVRQTKNIQIAMILQMQLPMIEKIAKAMFKGTKSLTKGEPIGDAAGPYIVASLIGESKIQELDEDVILTKTSMDKRNVFILKSKGPGGRLGRLDKAVNALIAKNKITRVITIDAAAKLEGERTGSVAEGVGIAMGGPGVERFQIEELLVKKDIPLDSIVVKMSQEEAITPMRKAVKDSLKEVRQSIRRSMERTKRGDNIIIIGVGNTSGVGNTGRDARQMEEWIEKREKRIKAIKKNKKKFDIYTDI